MDEIFFVDLPDASIRRLIFEIHLRKRELNPDHFDLDQLALASEGFSGAEIEQAVVAARYSAEQRALTTELILQEINNTSPLSVVMAEPLQELRRWAAERTIPA